MIRLGKCSVREKLQIVIVGIHAGRILVRNLADRGAFRNGIFFDGIIFPGILIINVSTALFFLGNELGTDGNRDGEIEIHRAS